MDTPKPDLIFDLGHFLGDGGQADVFLLRLRATGSVFAGKFLREVWDPSAREAFKKEAERQARVASDHIVRIVTWNFDVPKPFVVMEYMPRGSLAKEVERRGGFTRPRPGWARRRSTPRIESLSRSPTCTSSASSTVTSSPGTCSSMPTAVSA